jgi:DNA-binding response OmpR family regulator
MFLEEIYEVHTAQSGTDALRILNSRECTPDIIMLDIDMPAMNGWELFQRIRAISFLDDVPIAFLTSMDGSEVKNRARAMGAADFITKPLNMTDLRSRLKDILRCSGYGRMLPHKENAMIGRRWARIRSK